MSMIDTLAGVHETQPTQPVVSATEVQEPAKATGGHSVSVIPYNACLDPQADTFLPWLWKKMQDDDLVDYYFPGQKDTGFATFVRLFSGDAQVALFKTEDEQAGNTWEERIPGFITWSQTRMGASDVLIAGFIFFRKFWDHQTTDHAAQAAFAYWFRNPEIKIVLGVCPSLHVAAMRYNKRVGLHEIGRIPMAHMYKGQTCDAILYAITRDEWQGEGLMPAAALPIIGSIAGGAGSAASGMGGKKAQNKANSLAQQQLGLEQGMFNKGAGLIQPASDYWNALMHGGQAAVQATGPIASQIGQAAQGARNSISAMTPRGGEQNLAMAQNYNQTSNDISRLYAGMQPLAAQNLGQLGGLFTGAGQSLAFPATMGGLGASQMGMQNAQGGAQGFGSLLYNSLNKLRAGGGGAGGGAQLGGKGAAPATG